MAWDCSLPRRPWIGSVSRQPFARRRVAAATGGAAHVGDGVPEQRFVGKNQNAVGSYPEKNKGASARSGAAGSSSRTTHQVQKLRIRRAPRCSCFRKSAHFPPTGVADLRSNIMSKQGAGCSPDNSPGTQPGSPRDCG
jgi:hypothetical protein